MTLQLLVQQALMEDIGQGDITTNAIVSTTHSGTATIYAKQDLVVCGHDVAQEVFKQMGAQYVAHIEAGKKAKVGEVVATVSGPYRSLLTAERLALNFLMRLSGIATHTNNVIQGITGVRIVDTRKTTPLLRALERRAVVIGGAANHRFALYDGILIKDNHIAIAGSISKAIEMARSKSHHLLKIEIEVETISQLTEALAAKADVIMLDNMTDEQLKTAVEINNGRAILEASGNMNRQRILRIQSFGIHVISMGGLIHQATWADLSMKITRQTQ